MQLIICLKTSRFKVNTHHSSWVVDRDICVHEWNFNGKRVLQKYHFSIPKLDTLQIASGPAIPKGTFMWPQVAQHIIQKGKRRRKYVCISKARSSYMARLTLHQGVLGTGLVWVCSCALCNPASLVSAPPSWYSQLLLCRIASNTNHISGRYQLRDQHKRNVWFGSHKLTVFAVCSVKALVEITMSNRTEALQYEFLFPVLQNAKGQ